MASCCPLAIFNPSLSSKVCRFRNVKPCVEAAMITQWKCYHNFPLLLCNLKLGLAFCKLYLGNIKQVYFNLAIFYYKQKFTLLYGIEFCRNTFGEIMHILWRRYEEHSLANCGNSPNAILSKRLAYSGGIEYQNLDSP